MKTLGLVPKLLKTTSFGILGIFLIHATSSTVIRFNDMEMPPSYFKSKSLYICSL
jgi:hypothetical protein